jgi:hypothetical protein
MAATRVTPWQRARGPDGGEPGPGVELARRGTWLALRESGDPATVLTTTAPRLGAFLTAIKTGGWRALRR